MADPNDNPGASDGATPPTIVDQALQRFFDESGKLAGAIGETTTKLSDLQVKYADIDKRLEEIAKKHADSRKSLYGGDNLKDVIPERFRKRIRQAEIACHMQKTQLERHGQRRGLFVEDPILKVAAGAWLAGQIRLMNPAMAGEFRKNLEAHEKLENALWGDLHEKVALQEDVAAEGGNLVPTVVEGEILRLLVDNSKLRPLVRVVTMTTKSHKFPTLDAELSAALLNEEGTAVDSLPANPFGQADLTARKFVCFATVTQELLQDNVVGLADWLGMEFAMKIGRLEDTQGLEGDGSAGPPQQFTGVVAASGVNAVTSGANGDFLSYGKLADTYAQVDEQPADRNYWFMNRRVIGVLIRSRVGAGGTVDLPFFIPPLGGIAAPVPAALFGDTIITHSGILRNRTVGTGSNRTNVYYGPPSTIIFGDLLGFQLDLNPWGKFSTFQVDIRGMKRTGILVGVPKAWTKYTAIDPTGVMGA